MSTAKTLQATVKKYADIVVQAKTELKKMTENLKMLKAKEKAEKKAEKLADKKSAKKGAKNTKATKASKTAKATKATKKAGRPAMKKTNVDAPAKKRGRAKKTA